MTKDYVMSAPELYFAQPNYKEHDNVFNSAMALYYLVLNYRKTEDDDIRDRIIQHVKTFTQSGMEPQFDVHAFHSYVPTTAAIALIKHTPALYEVLSKDVKNRLRVIMKAFAVIGIEYFHSDNWLDYNIAMFHPFSKTQTPNLNMPIYFVTLGARYYAGSAEAFKYLVMGDSDTFDYDRFIQELQDCGFARALRTFERYVAPSDIDGLTFATVKDMFETRTTAVEYYGVSTNNVPERIGIGRGIHFPYSIKDVFASTSTKGVWYQLDDYMETLDAAGKKLVNADGNCITSYSEIYGNCYKDRMPIYMIKYLYHGGKCKNEVPINTYIDSLTRSGAALVKDSGGNTFTAHTLSNNSKNPSLGKDGMLSEFDWGARSDIVYCYLDFAMATVVVSLCRELDFVDDNSLWDSALTIYHNGSEDLFYKDTVGYVGYNTWAGDYNPVERQDCESPFYVIAREIYNEYEK